MLRKIVSIRKIDNLTPIKGADFIVCSTIDGWKTVVGINDFKIGDYCVFYELDSVLPIIEPFTSIFKDSSPTETMLEDESIVEGYRIRTKKFKKMISQGLALPLKPSDNVDELLAMSAEELCKYFNVYKYEKVLDESMKEIALGGFPSWLKTSEQERVQNLKNEIWHHYTIGTVFQQSVKLEGESLTVFRRFGRLGCCSRSIEFKMTAQHPMVFAAIEFDKKLGDIGDYVFQGELCGPGILKNFEGLETKRYFVYNQFSADIYAYAHPYTTHLLVGNDNYVPVLQYATLREMFSTATNVDELMEQMIKAADGKSAFNGKCREGLVYKSNDGQFSFKTISNQFLLEFE